MAHAIWKLEHDGIIPSLPHEIRVYVLSKIPISDLIRCTAVCKSWRAVIKDRLFIKDYNQNVRNSANEDGTQLILVHGYNIIRDVDGEDMIHGLRGEFYSLHYDDHAFIEHKRLEVPLLETRLGVSFSEPVASDGIVLLADWEHINGFNFIFCNPAIRKSVEIPRPNVILGSPGLFDESFGFGYDATTNDYKVVIIVSHFDETPDGQRGALNHNDVEVFSFATQSWRRLETAPLVSIEGLSRAALVNGALHWSASRMEDNSPYNFVLVFDISTESFLPNMLMPESVRTVEVENMKLSISSSQRSIALFIDYEVWVLNDYGRPESWTLLIEDASGGLCFMRSGELIISDDDEDYNGLSALNPMTQLRRRLLDSDCQFYTLYHFGRQTLHLLNEENARSY